MRASLFNKKRLNFDNKLSFGAIKNVVSELVEYEETKPDQVKKRAKDCEVLISKELLLKDGTINDLPESVSLICEAGTGVDNIAIEAAEKRGIKVCNVPNYSTAHVGQLTLNFILLLSSDLHRLALDDTKPVDLKHSEIFEVNGKTLGVIGAGAIGKQVIRLARSFGMNIFVYSSSVHQWNDQNIEQVSLDEVLTSSDFLTLHCPLNKDTRHLIRSETLSRMKHRAYIINTARGKLINHDDLAEALKKKHIAGAALDVQDPEPLPLNSDLRKMENVVLTDHIGWKAIEARQRLITAVANNIREFRATGVPLNEIASS